MFDFRYKSSATAALIEVLDNAYQNSEKQNNVHDIYLGICTVFQKKEAIFIF